MGEENGDCRHLPVGPERWVKGERRARRLAVLGVGLGLGELYAEAKQRLALFAVLLCCLSFASTLRQLFHLRMITDFPPLLPQPPSSSFHDFLASKQPGKSTWKLLTPSWKIINAFANQPLYSPSSELTLSNLIFFSWLWFFSIIF